MSDQLQPLRDSFAAMAANFDSMAALADIYREERDQQQIRAEAAEAELREVKAELTALRITLGLCSNGGGK